VEHAQLFQALQAGQCDLKSAIEQLERMVEVDFAGERAARVLSHSARVCCLGWNHDGCKYQHLSAMLETQKQEHRLILTGLKTGQVMSAKLSVRQLRKMEPAP
jgi:hypothetical protein